MQNLLESTIDMNTGYDKIFFIVKPVMKHKYKSLFRFLKHTFYDK